jgi:hypothetical protein
VPNPDPVVDKRSTTAYAYACRWLLTKAPKLAQRAPTKPAAAGIRKTVGALESIPMQLAAAAAAVAVLITHAAFASVNADEGAPEVADFEACEGEPAGLCTSIRRFKHVCTKK